MSTPTLLVTGANGKLGRHVTELLLARENTKNGGAKVVAASRDTAKLADLAARGAETRRVDFDDPASLAEAFKGVDRVLIISTDSLGSGQRLRQHQAAVAAAKDAGVSAHRLYLDAEARRLGGHLCRRSPRHRSGHQGQRRALHHPAQRLVSGETC